MRRLFWLPLLALLASSAACVSSSYQQTSATGGASAAARALAAMSLEQRVGQLFMVGTPGGRPAASTAAAIRRYHVGNVVLMENTYGGRAVVRHTVAVMRRNVTRASTRGVGLLVASDQEGGYVRHLQGPGFSAMPTALQQGTWPTTRLRRSASRWGSELRAAGVNVDLAPVADTVPRWLGRANEPIGSSFREYGYEPRGVASHVVAVVRGMHDAHVATAAKHFPGLGRVRGNTDFSSNVVDRVTRRGDAYLGPFRAAVRAGVPMVMMSTAWYPRIDAHNPASFSRAVIGTVLRGDLGFRGVVVSDSFDTPAVAGWTPAQRALKFLRAGGDLVLVTSADPVPAMYGAVLREARRNPVFRAKVDHSALRVLAMKQAQGLLRDVS